MKGRSELGYRQHLVEYAKNKRIHFKEVDSMFHPDIPVGKGIQSHGVADTITDFVLSLRIGEQWEPYGYSLRFVVRLPQSKSMTAIFTKTYT